MEVLLKLGLTKATGSFAEVSSSQKGCFEGLEVGDSSAL